MNVQYWIDSNLSSCHHVERSCDITVKLVSSHMVETSNFPGFLNLNACSIRRIHNIANFKVLLAAIMSHSKPESLIWQHNLVFGLSGQDSALVFPSKGTRPFVLQNSPKSCHVHFTFNKGVTAIDYRERSTSLELGLVASKSCQFLDPTRTHSVSFMKEAPCLLVIHKEHRIAKIRYSRAMQ